MAGPNEITIKGTDSALARIDSLPKDQLARHANAAAREAENRALYHACVSGIFLLKARERCAQDGTGWHEWLAEEWHYSRKTADRFIAIAEGCNRDPEMVPSLEAKSVRAALATLGRPVEAGRKSETDPRKALENKEVDGTRVSRDPSPTPKVIDVAVEVRDPAPRAPATSRDADGPRPEPESESAAPSCHVPSIPSTSPLHVYLERVAARAAGSMPAVDAIAMSNARAAQGAALLLEAGILRYHLVSRRHVAQDAAWGLSAELESVARRMGRRFVQDAERAIDLPPPVSGTSAPWEASQRLAASQLGSEQIREAAFDVHPLLGPAPRAHTPVEPEQLALLLLRDAWAQLDHMAQQLRGARGEFARGLRNAIDPVVTAAEAFARERCGENAKPSADPKKRAASAEPVIA